MRRSVAPARSCISSLGAYESGSGVYETPGGQQRKLSDRLDGAGPHHRGQRHPAEPGQLFDERRATRPRPRYDVGNDVIALSAAWSANGGRFHYSGVLKENLFDDARRERLPIQHRGARVADMLGDTCHPAWNWSSARSSP